MKSSLAWLCLTVCVVTGCAHNNKAAPGALPASSRAGAGFPTAKVTPDSKPEDGKSLRPIVTPDASLAGKVASYNEAGRFVVMEFPIGHLPAIGQKLFVYRNGLKVGEVNVSGPQRDDHIVGDLAAGEAQMTDEVRDK